MGLGGLVRSYRTRRCRRQGPVSAGRRAIVGRLQARGRLWGEVFFAWLTPFVWGGPTRWTGVLTVASATTGECGRGISSLVIGYCWSGSPFVGCAFGFGCGPSAASNWLRRHTGALQIFGGVLLIRGCGHPAWSAAAVAKRGNELCRGGCANGVVVRVRLRIEPAFSLGPATSWRALTSMGHRPRCELFLRRWGVPRRADCRRRSLNAGKSTTPGRPHP